jgi:MFS family permease
MPSTVKALTFEQFFEGFVPITALYVLVFDRVGGLSFQQISILFSVWSISFLAAELPSGVLADYWSRKRVIILGGILRAVGFLFWILFPSFWGYLIGFVLWGFMIACSSGATSAFLRSELEAKGKESKFTKYYGVTAAGLSVGALAGYIIASILTVEHATTLLHLSFASSLAGSITLLFVKEATYKRQSSYIQTLKSGFTEFKSSPRLQIIGFILFSTFMVYGVLEEFIPRLYADFGLSDTKIALTIALTYVFSITLLLRLERYVKFSLAKQTLGIIFGVVLFVGSLYLSGYLAASLVLLFGLVLELARSLFLHHIQNGIKGDEKATIASIPGLAGGLLGAIAYIAISLLSNVVGDIGALQTYGVIWVLVLIFATVRARKLN